MSDMNHMDQERLEELKAAHALDALTEDERRELEEHLAEHPEQQAELEELSSVAGMLALSTEEHEPPEELRRNLLDAVGDGARESESRERTRWPGWLPGLRDLALGAAAVALVALVAWNLILQNDLGELRAEVQNPAVYVVQGVGVADSASGELVTLGEEHAVLVTKNMNQLPEGKVCQIWVIKDGAPIPAGTFRPEKEPVAAQVQAPIEGASALAVTIEPEGGSEQPTTDPVMESSL